jgi:hypothetical protein
MKPVAECLDILQSEDNAFMGILLPNLKLMKDKLTSLKTDTSIKEGQELVNFLLENPNNARVAFKGRFEHLFQDEDLLMATALHPHFKLGVVGFINRALKEDIRMRVVNEVTNMASPVEEISDEEKQSRQDDPFKYMRGDDGLGSPIQGGFKMEVEGTYASWNRVAGNSKICVSYDQFPLLQRDAWLDVFSKYNSPLPSSAAVERLFSFGSDILRAKRSSLTADNFEKLVFVKGNMHLLK